MAVTEQKEYLQTLVKNTTGLLVLLDTEGIVLESNQSAIEWFGTDLKKNVFQELQSIDVATKERLAEAIKFVSEKAKAFTVEDTKITPDGPKTYSITLRPVHNSTGTVANIICEGFDVSEQKQLEHSSAQEQAFSKAILDNTAEGIFVFDNEGELQFSNEVARKMFYFERYPNIQDLTVNSAVDFYTLDQSQYVTANELPFALALKGQEVENFELFTKLKDVLPDELEGLKQDFKPISLSVSSRVIKNDSDEITSIVLSYRDISYKTEVEQRQAKVLKTRLELQERFSHAFENAVIGMAILSSRGDILEVNSSLASALGYEAQELVGKALNSLTHIDNLSLTETIFSEIESGISNSIFYEKKLKHKSGNPVDMIMGVSANRDEQDQINYIIVHMLDVTKNNQMSKALELSQQNYQSIFNSQLDAVIVTNLSGKILNVNPSAVKLFGYSTDEIDGLMIWELFSTKEDQRTLFDNLLIDHEEQVRTDVVRYLHHDGDAFPAETVGFLIFDSEGQRQGYTWIIQDISEKKIAEITLARINQGLAVSREEERRRLARELHDGIVQDLMGFSYELASNESRLNADENFAVDSASLKGMRYQLTHSIKQLRTFISDLRPVGLEEFGFQSAIESYIALIERDREQRRNFPEITVEVKHVGDLPIPLNLCLFRSAQEALANIVKHAKAQHVFIELILEESTKDASLILKIRDDGIGFNVPENISEFSDKQHFGLVGIDERVSLLNGNLSIESAPYKGTTLKITLPYETEL